MAELLYPGTKTKVSVVAACARNELFFGCHCIGIANLTFTMSAPYGGLSGTYGERLNGEQQMVMRKLLEENEEARYQVFKEFANQFGMWSLVFMTCPCNTREKPDLTHHNYGPLSIAGFAGWLEEQGEFIMGSPLVTNRQHQTSSFSLLRGWMWVPTTAAPTKHIEGTEYVAGKMKSGLPFPQWWDYYQDFHKRAGISYSMRSGKNESHPGYLKEFTVDELYGRAKNRGISIG